MLHIAESRRPLYLQFEDAWLAELAPHGLRETEAFHDFLRVAWQKHEVLEERNRLAPRSANRAA